MITKENIHVFENFQHHIWTSLDVEKRIKALQDVVDIYSKQFGVDRLCEVFASKLDNGVNGAYYAATKEIAIQLDIIANGEKRNVHGKCTKLGEPAIYALYYLMHELKHAIQYHYMANPHLCEDKRELLLIQNNRWHKDGDSTYIKNCEHKGTIGMYLSYMYVLQPLENYAWNFANEEVDKLIAEMQKYFANEIGKNFTKFDVSESIEFAKSLFSIEDPAYELNKILLVLNGYDVGEELNETMCEVIRETQEPQMNHKIEDYLTNREMIAAQPIVSGCDMDDIDLDDLFDDNMYKRAEYENSEYQRVGSDIEESLLDDLFQDLS